MLLLNVLGGKDVVGEATNHHNLDVYNDCVTHNYNDIFYHPFELKLCKEGHLTRLWTCSSMPQSGTLLQMRTPWT